MAVHVAAVPDRPDVVVVTLDRPERRNALDHETLGLLREAVSNALMDECRALVLTGASGHFCAGADLAGVEDEEFVAHLLLLLEALHAASFPVIAAIEGAALGAGTQLAMACDLRVATAGSTFGIPAARLGLTIDLWTAHHLAQQAGGSTARAMLVGAEVFTGAQLHGSGFVHRLHDDEEATVAAAGVAWACAVADLAPLTIAAHKAMLRTSEQAGPVPNEVREARAVAWHSSDLQEGLAAFRERRPARFQGR